MASLDSSLVSDQELAQRLETKWMERRDDFLADLVTILTERFTQSAAGSSTSEAIAKVIELALTPHTTTWHPFDLVMQSWRFEGLVRHAADLYLLANLTVPPKVNVQSSTEFGVWLIELAANECLDSRVTSPQEARLSSWLGGGEPMQ